MMYLPAFKGMLMSQLDMKEAEATEFLTAFINIIPQKHKASIAKFDDTLTTARFPREDHERRINHHPKVNSDRLYGIYKNLMWQQMGDFWEFEFAYAPYYAMEILTDKEYESMQRMIIKVEDMAENMPEKEKKKVFNTMKLNVITVD